MKIIGFIDECDGFYQVPVQDDESDLPEWTSGYTRLTEADRLARIVAPTTAQIVSKITDQVQSKIDVFVQTKGYDGVNALAKYSALTDAQISAMPTDAQAQITQFRSECQYVAGLVALTWVTCYSILATVEAGNWPTTGAGQQPTDISDIEASLPTLAWSAA